MGVDTLDPGLPLSPLREVLTEQHGLIHREQLLDLGVTRGQLRWRLDREWRLVLPGVVATFTGRLDHRHRLVAACLFAGPDAVVTSTTAARWRGATNVVRDPVVRLVVPAHRRPRRGPLLEIRRTTRPDPKPWRRGGLVVASPARAFADAARDAPAQRDAMALVVEVVQRRLVSTDHLMRELEDGPRCGSTFLRAGIDAALTGAWSLPEHDLIHRLEQCGRLPAVFANPCLRADDGTELPTPDAWLDDVGLAIQLHSRRHHFDVEEWEGTILRDGVFAEYGVPHLAFTPRRLRDDPDWLVRRVLRVHERLLDSPRPAVFAELRG
jgi:hypothetical protein